MATDPEFVMKGITHVIAAPGGDHHPILFRFTDPEGRPVQVQAVLHTGFTIPEVIAELQLLATNIRLLSDPEYRASLAVAAGQSSPPPSQ